MGTFTRLVRAIYAGQAPIEGAPKLTLEQHDAIATLKSEDLEYVFQMQAIQKRFQDALNADPDFKAIQAKKEGVEKQLQEEVQKAMKSVDPKKWRVDMNTIQFVPVTPQEEPKKK
jgi:uncharacterized protein involved in exopolysaccharide biosynthesis